MEILSNNVGQVFANASVNTKVSPQQVNPVDQRTIANSGDQAVNTLEQNPSNKGSEGSVDEKNTKNLTQASDVIADNALEGSDELANAVAEVESFLKVQNRDLAFSIDEETNRAIVTVKDSQSGDVIRQIPSEEVLKLAEQIQNLQADVSNSVGVFINKQV